MELVVSCKNYKELNKIRKHLVEDYLDTSIEFSTYKIIGTDTQKITIDIEEEITRKEIDDIINLFEKIKYNHRFLYHGFELPIKQLKSLNDKYNCILKYKKLYYYDPSLLTEELIDFAHIFVNHFKFDFVTLPVNAKEIKNNLGLRSLGLVSCKIENINGRLYISYDGEEHHMEYDDLSKFLYHKMESSDLEVHYDIENNMDKFNTLEIYEGKSPVSYFDRGEYSSYEKFKLLISFSKLCNKDNLPMLNPKDINGFVKNIFGFKYYSLKLGRLIEEEYEKITLEDYKEHEFDDLEHALAFSIYLSGFRIKHYVMKDQVSRTFTVCYVYKELLDPYPDYKDMRSRFINYLHLYHSVEVDEFKYMKLKDLFKCTIIRDTVVFDNYDVIHINPLDGEPIPIDYFDIKGQQRSGIYNIGNVIKGLFNRVPLYNRDNLVVREVSIEVKNGKIIIDNNILKDEIFFQHENRAKNYLHKLWEKGYFLNSYGLNYYLETGEISKSSIVAPEWLTLENSSEKDFYKFLNFNGF